MRIGIKVLEKGLALLEGKTCCLKILEEEKYWLEITFFLKKARMGTMMKNQILFITFST